MGLDQKRMLSRLRALRNRSDIQDELITCCDLVAKFKADTDEEKLIMKGFIEDIFSVLMSSDDLLTQLNVAQHALLGNIRLANKFVRIALGFCVGREMDKNHVLALIQLLNNLIKSDSHTLVPLSGANFAEAKEQLVALRRLLEFAHSNKLRQLF